MKTAVVILNWNGKRFLEQFLPSLVEHSANDAQIIVADNASTDDSLEFLRKNYPSVRVILNSENGGFAKGYNDALKRIDATYYILLNSDIEVTTGWIAPVIDIMDRNPEVAACQPKIRSYTDRPKFEYAGAAGGFIDKYGYPFCRGRIFQTLETDTGQYNDPCEVFWATGACMFVRANLFHLLGGFDEDFFAHMEEIDFCWRLRNEGYKVMYCPSSTVYHIGGGTLPKASWRKTYLNFRNNFYLLYKNLPEDQLTRVFVVRLLLDGIAAVKFLFQAGFKDFWAVTRAHISFYRTLPKLKAKRRNMKQRSMTWVYSRNIVSEYYIHGKKYFSVLDPERFFRD
jgi:GT2 family glycosyltransferase